jgi:hypothetical protein
MSEPTRQTSRGFRRLGAVIAVFAATLVILSAGAFAVGRNTATHTATQTAPSESMGTHHGPTGAWVQNHDNPWMRAHADDLMWIRHHQAQWSWMRGHMHDVAWMRAHLRPIRWMHEWAIRLWLHAHTGQRGWAQDHPRAWSSMQRQMRHMVRGNWNPHDNRCSPR